MALRGVGNNELARLSGRGPGYFSKVLNEGRENVRPTTISEIAAALRVSREWLATGHGSMLDGTTAWGEWPGWVEAEVEARARAPRLDWAIRGARSLPVTRPPNAGELDWTLVVALAEYFMKTAQPAEKIVANRLESEDRTAGNPSATKLAKSKKVK